MKSLYNTALRQSRAIRTDLDEATSAITGGGDVGAPQISSLNSSLNSFKKAIDDYDVMARQEIMPKKKTEAVERTKEFRQDLQDFRSRLDFLKKQREEAKDRATRNDLLGGASRAPPSHQQTAANPYLAASAPSASVFARPGPSSSAAVPLGGYGAPAQPSGGYSFGSGDPSRENHALREQAFFQRTNNVLDDYIAQGQALYGDLKVQNSMLKNVQKNLYSAANTLGISGDTIRMVERRAREDKWIFGVGVVVFFLFCWLVLHFFG